MASQGPRNPTAAAEIVATWNNPTYVYASDTNRADSSSTSAIMAATGFGFSGLIPSNAVIDGIQIELQGYGAGSSAVRRRAVVGLTKDGSNRAGDYGSAVDLGASESGYVINQGSDGQTLWGTTWSVSDVTASTFGVLIQPSGTTGYTRYVNHVRVTVYYTIPDVNVNLNNEGVTVGESGQSDIQIEPGVQEPVTVTESDVAISVEGGGAPPDRDVSVSDSVTVSESATPYIYIPAKFFFQSTGTPPVSPAFETTVWNIYGEMVRRNAVLVKGNTALADFTATETEAAQTWVGVVQFVSPPLAAKTIPAGTRVRISVRLKESDAAADIDRAMCYIRIVSEDGATPKSGLISSAFDFAEWPTALESRVSTGSGELLTGAERTLVAGDRIKFEFGFRANNASTSPYAGTYNFGDAPSNPLDYADGDTDEDYPWLDFTIDLSPYYLEPSVSDPVTVGESVSAYVEQLDLSVSVSDSVTASESNSLYVPGSRFYIPWLSSSLSQFTQNLDMSWWDYSPGITRWRLQKQPGTSTYNGYQINSAYGVAYPDVSNKQFYSHPLKAKEWTTSDKLKFQGKFYHDGSPDTARPSMSIRVVSGDGNTVRGTLFQGHGLNLIITNYNRGFGVCSVQNAVSMQEGDRLLVEIGAHWDSDGTTWVYFRGGGAPADPDCPEDESNLGGSTYKAWIEFNSDLVETLEISVSDAVTVTEGSPTIRVSTLFYFSSSKVPPVNTISTTSWNEEAQAVRRVADLQKDGSGLMEVSASETAPGSAWHFAIAKFTTPPLKGQTIPAGTPIHGSFRWKESAADADMSWALIICVYSKDGQTKIGELYGTRPNTTEFALSLTSRGFSTVVSQQERTLQEGDRLQIELGVRADNTTTDEKIATVDIGSAPSTLLTPDDADTDADCPWISFGIQLKVDTFEPWVSNAVTLGEAVDVYVEELAADLEVNVSDAITVSESAPALTWSGNGFQRSSPTARYGDTLAYYLTTEQGAAKFVCPGTGYVSINEIGAWLYCINDSKNLKLAVFTHDAANDCPAELVAETNAITISYWGGVPAKVSFSFTSSPTLTGGETYWFAFTHDDAIQLSKLNASSSLYKGSRTYPTWPTDTEWHTHSDIGWDLSTYVVYTECHLVSASDSVTVGESVSVYVEQLDLSVSVSDSVTVSESQRVYVPGTRFYFPWHSTLLTRNRVVTVAFDSEWDQLSSESSQWFYKLSVGKKLIASTIKSLGAPDAGHIHYGGVQYLSSPLEAHSWHVGEGIKCQTRAYSNRTDYGGLYIIIRVVSEDGQTVRGTLFTGEFPTLVDGSGGNYSIGGPLAGSVAVQNAVEQQAGDRVVVELGGFWDNTDYCSMNFYGGDPATDLPEDETTTSSLAPWVEFSATLKERTLEVYPVIDTVTKTESGTVNVEVNVNVSDSVTIAESGSVEIEVNTSLSESITVSEYVELSGLEAGETREVSVSDSVTVGEQPPIINVSDIFLSTEQGLVAGEQPPTAEVTDIFLNTEQGVSVGESGTPEVGEILLGTSQGVSVLDVPTLETGELSSPIVSDSVAVTDTASAEVSEVLVLSTQGVAVGEYVELSGLEAGPTREVNVSDSVTAGEQPPTVQVGDLTLVTTQAVSAMEDPPTVQEEDLVVLISEAVTPTEVPPSLLNGDVLLNTFQDVSVGEFDQGQLGDLVLSTEQAVLVGESVEVLSGDISVSSVDSLSVGESGSSSESDVLLTATEAVSVGESTSGEVSELFLSTSDSVLVSEVLEWFVTAPGEYQLSVYDSIAAQEYVEAWRWGKVCVYVTEYVEVFVETASVYTVEVLDSVQLAESIVEEVSEPQLTTWETISVVEAPTLVVGDIHASTSDGVAVTETQPTAVIENVVASTSDAVAITEQTTLLVSELVLSTTQDVGVSDVPSVEVEAGPSRYVEVYDGVAVGEAGTIENGDLILQTSQGVALEEWLLLENQLGGVWVADGLSVSEAGSASLELWLEIQESILNTEFQACLVSDLLLTTTDSIGVGESLQLLLPFLAVAVFEGVQAIENAWLYYELSAQSQDGVQVGDQAVLDLTLELYSSQGLTIEEYVVALPPGWVYDVLVSEPIHVTDIGWVDATRPVYLTSEIVASVDVGGSLVASVGLESEVVTEWSGESEMTTLVIQTSQIKIPSVISKIT